MLGFHSNVRICFQRQELDGYIAKVAKERQELASKIKEVSSLPVVTSYFLYDSSSENIRTELSLGLFFVFWFFSFFLVVFLRQIFSV